MRRTLVHPFARASMVLTPSQRGARLSRFVVLATLVASAVLVGTLVVSKLAG